jgi:hypothetical protein
MVRIALGITAVLGAGLMAACGSSTSDTPTPTAAAASIITPTPAPATIAPAPTAAPVTVQLSGTWSGQYSGVYQGTFTLTWQQTGSSVNGDIMLSSPAKTYHINGSLSGNAIQFGAVGAVTYSGTVNGNSMSGTYSTPIGGTGSWNASKS